MAILNDTIFSNFGGDVNLYNVVENSRAEVWYNNGLNELAVVQLIECVLTKVVRWHVLFGDVGFVHDYFDDVGAWKYIGDL